MRFASGAWGIFEPESGALMARRAVRAVVDEAVRNGAAFVPAAASRRRPCRSGSTSATRA
jgi:hypothetical protein